MPPLDQLPPTIRDSIILCRLLKRRYLWIDSLCITQNDASTLRGQLEQMDLIYQCAEFTIVAAAGLGANAGLPGIDTTPRAPQQAGGDSSQPASRGATAVACRDCKAFFLEDARVDLPRADAIQ